MYRTLQHFTMTVAALSAGCAAFSHQDKLPAPATGAIQPAEPTTPESAPDSAQPETLAPVLEPAPAASDSGPTTPSPRIEDLEAASSVPPTVQNFQQPLLWRLQLGEALHVALENNPMVAVQQFVPELARTEVMQGMARFDPQVEANQHWSTTQQHLVSSITTFGTGINAQRVDSYGLRAGYPDQLAVSKQLRTGASVRAGFSTGFADLSPTGSFNTINPSWRSQTSLQLSQPLMRGRGKRIQMLPVRIAQAYEQTTENDFQSILLKLMRDVEFSYWNLAFAQQNLEVRRQNVIEARKTYEKELQKQAVGESSRPEVGEAKLHYHHMVDLYHMRKSELLEDERAFRELLGIPGFDGRRVEVILPEEIPELNVDWDWSVTHMLANRPDLVSQRYTMKSAEMSYRLAMDKCQPEFNFVGRVGKSGLDDEFGDSVGRMLSDEDHSWLVGFHYVRDVNRCAAKAEAHRAYLQWHQQAAFTKQLEHNALHQLQNAYEKLHQKVDRVQQLTNLREAASERLAAYDEKFELGELAIELYLRVQAADSDAELQVRSAKIELLQQIVHFEYVRGTLLNSRSILVQSEAPVVTPAKNLEGELLEPPQPPVTTQPGGPGRPRAPEFKEMLKDINPKARDWLLQEGA